MIKFSLFDIKKMFDKVATIAIFWRGRKKMKEEMAQKEKKMKAIATL